MGKIRSEVTAEDTSFPTQQPGPAASWTRDGGHLLAPRGALGEASSPLRSASTPAVVSYSLVLLSQGRDVVLEAAVLDARWSCSRDRDTQAGH